MMYVCQEFDGTVMHRAEDKTELIEQLRQQEEAVVILDYTLFDINDVEELKAQIEKDEALCRAGVRKHREGDNPTHTPIKTI